jgi:peptidyl-Lys metalloendopeptidase
MELLRIAISAAGELVRVQVTNQSDRTLRILKWNTVLDAPHVHGLQVLRNGVPLEYTGPYFKRLFDPQVSLVTLGPGAYIDLEYSLESILDDFDCREVRAEDTITITVAGRTMPVLDEVQPSIRDGGNFADVTVDFSGASVAVSVEKALSIVKKKEDESLIILDEPISQQPLCVFGHNSGYEQMGPTSSSIVGFPVSSGFDVARQTIIKNVVRLIFENRIEIRSVSNTALYRRWFGGYSSENKDLVERTLRSAIQGACPGYLVLDGTNTGRCSSDTYAFVIYDRQYNENPKQCSSEAHHCHRLFLCPLFWQRPFRGADSQTGILIHELTHAFSYTADHRYGRARCLDLARTSPALAITNADNFEYYVEELIG